VADAVDEGRHRPGPERWWNESWYFDFAALDASVGGYVRLGLYPNQSVAWWWAFVCGPDRELVALRAHDIPLPRTGTEIRDDGVWACLTAETPNEHWSVGLEAFAVALADPADAYRGERGDRLPLGLDLEWEAVAPPYDYPGLTRYEQSCIVHGEILVGDERIAFDGPGQRDHSWGVRDWWTTAWCWTSGRLEDGTRFHASAPLGIPYEPGYLVDPDGLLCPHAGFQWSVEEGADRLPRSCAMRLGPLSMAATPVALAPILLTDEHEGRVARFPRALCSFAVDDGRSGVGWTEWNQP
jgi:hypothetical protein